MTLTVPVVAADGARSSVTLPDPVVTTGSGTPVSLFTTQTPVVNTKDGTTLYELGTKIQANTTGTITGIRFWKGSSETGTHTGKIYSATGTLLASQAFSGETASGWQIVTLTTPLAVTANTTYVVTVNTPNGYYVATNNGLTTKITNGVLSSVVGGNGVYGPVGSLPASTYQASNYFRDVVFVAGVAVPDTVAPSVPAGLAASATSATTATLTWTASTDNVGVTGYNVFRNGTTVGTSPSASFNDTGLTNNTAYSYNVSAFDAAGNTSAQSADLAYTQNFSGGVSGPIPLNFNDPIFAGAQNMAGGVGVSVASGASLTLKSINGNPGYTSGDQAILLRGNNTLNQCRIDWREGPRIAGSGSFTLNQCFINCIGKSGDHADGIQAYSPGDTGTLNLTNCCMRSYSTSEAQRLYGSGFTGSDAIFWADSYQGTVNFNNVVIWGGDRGVTINADVATTTVNFTNVYFVPGSGESSWSGYPLALNNSGGRIVVGTWSNVCNATIVNGVIVPGTPIAHP